MSWVQALLGWCSEAQRGEVFISNEVGESSFVEERNSSWRYQSTFLNLLFLSSSFSSRLFSYLRDKSGTFIQSLTKLDHPFPFPTHLANLSLPHIYQKKNNNNNNNRKRINHTALTYRYDNGLEHDLRPSPNPRTPRPPIPLPSLPILLLLLATRPVASGI